MLLVCGGFYDGESAIVEPLADPCMMLPDCMYKRQQHLARQLFALQQGIATVVRWVRALMLCFSSHGRSSA